jgi:hypothetical protein
MTYSGTVQGGVVVLSEGVSLPEGTKVTVSVSSPAPKDGEAPEGTSIGQKMAELARWAESQPCDLPEDLAANHDYYLHGLPKRKRG